MASNQLHSFANRVFDRLLDGGIPLRGRAWSTFIFSGSILGVGVAAAAAALTGLSAFFAGAVAFAAGLSCLVMALVFKILTGEERYVFYHYQFAVLAVSGLLIWVLGAPLFVYLDLVVPALATALAFGRIGCLLAGCCHGKPHRWGARYGSEHGRVGLSKCYIGVRLLPVQAVESAWGFILLIGVVVALLGRAPAGTALVIYVVGYAAGRFLFEFFRGDPARPYWWCMYEAQWISAAFILVVVVGGLLEVLPVPVWYAVGLGAVAGMEVAVAMWLRRRRGDSLWARADQLIEFAEAIARIDRSMGQIDERDGIEVARTSSGFLISGGRLGAGAHYTLSRTDGFRSAGEVARLIQTLKNSDAAYRLQQGRETGIYHVIYD